ncbi:MAG: hypothetical protein HYS88_00130 [Candidatus Colwellbacteria bacterium]|nr:hypothetical protein [Candidatus Colwellbacteria bacterium]
MNKKLLIGIGVAAILVILGALLGKYIGYDIGFERAARDISQGGKSEEAQNIDETDIYSCDYWRSKPFGRYPEIDGGYLGSLTIEGNIIERLESAFWEDNKTVSAVYLEIEPQSQEPGKSFYNNYHDLVRSGNSINSLDGDTLLFRLGIRESSKLISTAKLLDQTSKRIVESINTRAPLSLNLVLPSYLGSEAPSEFSYACEINAE